MPKQFSPEKSFFERVQKTKSCWLWTGYLRTSGYGIFSIKNKLYYVHRLSLQMHGVEIPKGMVVDHVCRVRKCVNPDHLRIVSIAENVLQNSLSNSAINKRKTHCIRGHLLNEENTYKHKGRRQCRICGLFRKQKSRAKGLR